eukprot:tig00000448_g868.t1
MPKLKGGGRRRGGSMETTTGVTGVTVKSEPSPERGGGHEAPSLHEAAAPFALVHARGVGVVVAGEAFGESHSAIEAYFEAWAVLQRAGHSPSRLEAHLLRELADIHIRHPARLQLGFHLCSRMYWYTESEEDLFQEALCLLTSGQAAALRGDFRMAKAHLRRCMEMLSSMSPGYRVLYPRVAGLLLLASLHTFDIPTALSSANRAFSVSAAMFGFGLPEHDVTSATRDRVRAHVEARVPFPGETEPPSPQDFVRLHRFSVFLLSKLSPRARRMQGVMVGHMLYQLGQGYLHIGEWRKALGCFEKAREGLYSRYPAYFPPTGGRVRELAASMERCRAALAAQGPEPAPRSAFSIVGPTPLPPPLPPPLGLPSAAGPASFPRPAPSWHVPVSHAQGPGHVF